MFNSSSKMLVPRSKTLVGALARVLTLAAFCWALGAQAQQVTTPPQVIQWAPTGGLRVGDLAPQFELLDSEGETFDSRLLLGHQPLMLLLDGPTPTLKFNDDIKGAALRASTLGFTVALAASNPQIGKGYSWPAPFRTLRAPENGLDGVTLPAFLAIDRAGWLRQIEPLPTSESDPANVKLQILLAGTPDPTPQLEVGEIAPDFQFPDANGQWRRVSALRGRKNLLLTFFPKCFTGKCRNHLVSLREQFPAFVAANTEIWAVSVDPAQGETGQLAFARELILPFPLLPDVGRNVCILYGAAGAFNHLAQRQSVLIDKNGIVRWITKTVGVETHGEDVLAKITELGLAK
jgi:peroxiredoxin Q/BCP